jgi:Peptidase M60, enhancin and enhancin-like/N-terminal domain of M60-like peptidases
MKILNLISKSRAVSRSVLVIASVCLASCGGGGGGGTSTGSAVSAGNADSAVVPGTNTPSGVADTSNPTFNLKGFVYCGKQGDVKDFKVKTHVAFGLESDNRFVYLFNQTGKVLLSAETFGNDPIPSKYKEGYCKEVTPDNNDAVVFSAALVKIKAHIDGVTVLTAAELQEQNDRIAQTMYTLADKSETLLLAFSILTSYEAKEKGPFFLNVKTKNGFPNHPAAPDGFELDRAVLAIQQSIHDVAFTPDAIAKYKTILAGKKFNSSDWFPGKVKVPANPNLIYTARINASMAADVDLRTAFSQYFARRPTGYYLAAGDVAKVTVPATMVNKGYVIQVGANVHDKYIKSTIARPFRVTNKFPIVSEVTEIANPNGGGIYIDVPYLASAGTNFAVTIQNAVPAPFFSSTALNNTTLQQWQDIQRKNPAPWADFMSDKYMMTLPTNWIYNYVDPVALMTDWDKRMDVVSDLLGRNRVRNNQTLYLIVDTSLYSDAYGIGYPTGNNGYNPADATDGNKKEWFLTPGKDFSQVEFHELGHAQLFNNFPGEGEAAVNLLGAAVSNRLYGVNIDTALGRSMSNQDQITRDQAALNWMVTPNFRAGKAMDITSSEKNEVRYQQRGYAKYIEVAALFGWDKLDKFYLEENRVFRKEVAPAGVGLNAIDSQILRMSIAAGVDLTPLIYFWGVQPVDALALGKAMTAANLPSSAAIYDRLKVYQSQIPMDNAAFKAHAAIFLNKPAAQINGTNKSADYGEGWYAYWLDRYSAADGQAAQVAFNNILTRYFPGGRPI